MIKHVEIKNKDNKVMRGYLDMPKGANELVIFYHGFTGNKSEHAYHFRNFSRILSDAKIASLRLDFSGNGESDGEFRDFTMDTLMDDAKLIYEYAKTIKGIDKIDVLGFSMGGGVATMMSAIYGNEINKLILWSAAGTIPEHIRIAFEKGVKLENGNSLIGTYFELSKEMYDSTFKYDPFKGIEIYTNPVLLVHGRSDQAVDYLTSMKYAVTYKNAVVHIIDECGHGYDKVEQQKELYDVSKKFILTDYNID